MSSIHIRTALANIRRSPFQGIAAISVLTVTFFVMTILTTLTYSTDKILTHFETRPQVIAFIKEDVGVSEIAALQTKLQSDSRLKEVRYVSKEEALEIYKEATADNPLLSELVSPSIFPASLEFSLSELTFASDVITEVKSEGIVDQVGFTASLGSEDKLEDTVSRLKTLALYLRLGGGFFVAVLTFTSLFVLLVIISMRLTTRKQEVEILRLIGATGAFIRKPIIIESVMYAFLGVFLGWLLAFIIVLYSTPGVLFYFNDIDVLPRSTTTLASLFGVILAGELLVGIFLALLGSSIALSRSRKTR
jgi:cell division transport system permease protein